MRTRDLSAAKRLLAVLVTAIGLAGCGGGDDRLSAAELRERADAVCGEYEAKFRALGTPQTMAQLRTFADKALPIARDAREDLGELRPPEDLEQTYDRWLEEGDKAVEALERLRRAADRRDLQQIQRIGREAAVEDRRSDRLARQLGLRTCAQE